MDAIIESVCRIPLDFRRVGKPSVEELLKKSGYWEKSEVIIRENIRSYLETNVSLIQEWIQWSEDQRCHPAWVFSKGQQGYFLYHIPANGIDLTFDSGVDACAEFIYRWLSSAAERLRPA